MSVIRTIHNKENPYVMLNKMSLWDKDLPLQIVGLWVRLMSRPDNWKIRSAELAKSCGCNIGTIKKYLRKLENAGYAYRFQIKNTNGQFDGYETVVFENKMTEQEVKNMFPEHFEPSVQKQSMVEQPLLNIDITKERISPIVPKGEVCSSSRKKAKEEKALMAPEVHLTLKQMKDVLEKCGGNVSLATNAYRKLSEWKISKSISGGNDYLQMCRWAIKRAKEEAERPQPVDRVAADRALAETLKHKFPNHPDIRIGHNYVELLNGQGCDHLKFGDNGFQEQLENGLRKRGLNLQMP